MLLSSIQQLSLKLPPWPQNLTLNTRFQGIKEKHCAIILKKKRELASVQTGNLSKKLHKGRKTASQNSLRERNYQTGE